MVGTYGKLMELNQPVQAEMDKVPKSNVEGKGSPVISPIKKRVVSEPRHRDTKQPSNHETTIPGNRDTTIKTIRAAVKIFGKEAATHRFTPEEKKAIRDIVYAYEGRGIRTGENEISRIGVNFLIEDYGVNGENSVLHRVLLALNG
jgi:hypothetical protein